MPVEAVGVRSMDALTYHATHCLGPYGTNAMKIKAPSKEILHNILDFCACFYSDETF